MIINVISHQYVPWTTGNYVAEAAKFLGHEVVHTPPGQEVAGVCDFYLRVDDGAYGHGKKVTPSAYWAIDTVIKPERTVAIGAHYDRVYELHSGYTHLFDPPATTLSPAASHLFHFNKAPLKKDLHWAFVGSVTPEREKVLQPLLRALPDGVYGRFPPEKIKELYNRAVCVVNLNVSNAPNMRSYEGIMAGAWTLNREHPTSTPFSWYTAGLVPHRWRNVDHCVEIVQSFVDMYPELYPSLIQRQQYHLEHHTYVNRLVTILRDFSFDDSSIFPIHDSEKVALAEISKVLH